MVLIAPDITRFTINGTYHDRTVANILDMDINVQTTDRVTANFETAGNIINSWMEHVVQPAGFSVSEHYTFQSVSWVDLNDADGDTGERSQTSEWTLPQNGAQDAAEMPGNVAMLVTKEVTRNRTQRNGRWYIVGINELNTNEDDGNLLSSSAAAGFQANFSALLDELNDEPVIGGFDRHMVVVHTTTPSPGEEPVFNGENAVNALAVQQLLATQRRRLRG